MTPEIAFAARLKELRERLGMTQRELATLLDTWPMRISAWETGRQSPRALTMEAILTRIDAELKKRARKKPTP